MSPLFRWALRVYPASWRTRYARELEALLDDLRPGWRELWDVFKGGLTMRITTWSSVPVACAVAGGLIGGVVAFRMPTVYASTATIHLAADPQGNPRGFRHDDLRVTVDHALAAAHGRPQATSVMLLHNDAGQTTLRVTTEDPRPEHARRVTTGLTTAILTGPTAKARAAQVVEPPSLPTTPVAPAYATRVGTGSTAGLALGCVALLVRRRRARGNVA